MNKEEMTAKIVNDLFEVLSAIKPAFRQAWPTQREFENAKIQWIKAFMDINLNSLEKIQRGVKEFRLSPGCFIQSPGDFIALCKLDPSDIGAPETRKAYLEACRLSHPCETVKNWSHVVVRYAAQKTGSHFLRTETESKTYPVFEQNYREACEMFADGRIMQTLEYDDSTKEHNTEIEKQRAIILDSHKDIKSASQALKMMRNLLLSILPLWVCIGFLLKLIL